MEEKKRIDRLFQEKLKDYEVFPEPHVWKNIQQEIMEKKRRRIVPLWLRFGSAAAVLLLLISTGFWYFDQGDSLPNHNITVPSSVDSEADQPAKEENSDQNNSTKQIQNTTTTDQKNTSFENDERIKSTSSEPQKSSRSTFTDSDRNPVNSTAQANEPTNALANNDNVEEEREENKSNDQKLNLENKDFIDENTAIKNNQTK
ncbi:MAG: hypothetical protein HKN90_08845, partial [Flavobacteriaceae bacterium]|nr:hypothetical protein [Flavobacteriaceae bacterium]